MNLTVHGTGYLGAVHAACLAELGFEVLGTDIDQGRIAALSQGRAPFSEPGRDADPEILGQAVRRRNVLDTRHALDPARWRAAGWTYRALGRP